MEKTKKSTVVGFHVTREPRSFAYPFVSSPYDRCSAETANFLFLLVLSCHSPIIIHALVELKPQARRMQERAAVGLTLIETFWNFFCGKNGAKRCKRGKKGAKKGQKKSGLS
ncbi:hypothetical protein [Escherichia coli]|uniref:hypothetical protein n=1 Tax=Escherichia coli TaxID=562 RepID=UPI001FCDD737|nr:hypothetical protein [Escherichia coli]